MAKPEWGLKRLCPSCGARFYDLLRDPVPCPTCGAVHALEALSERKAAGPARSRPKPEKVAVAVAPLADGDDLIEDDDDDAVEDDVLLPDDDDDDDDLGEIGDVAISADDEET